MQTITESATKFNLKCGASGLLLADATPQFEVVAVTHCAARALPFPDLAAANQAADIVSSLYGSFDWRAVAA